MRRAGRCWTPRPFPSFNGGRYTIWQITGHVTITVTQTGQTNAVVSGLFFDSGTGGNRPPSITPATPDAGAIYTAPATIALASESNGISQVEFHEGTTLTAPPSSPGNPYMASSATVSGNCTMPMSDGPELTTVSAPLTVDGAESDQRELCGHRSTAQGTELAGRRWAAGCNVVNNATSYW